MSELDLHMDVTQALPEEIKLSFGVNFYSGLSIYIKSFFQWRIWLYMALSEIRRRYRRTVIGPFWVTLSIAIFIGSIGVIFPILWHTDIKTYLPFFSSGYIVWTFISSSTTEACGTFVDSSDLIKQTSLPYGVYGNNVVARNVLVLFHHLIVYVIVMLMFSVPISFKTLLFIPGMLILCFTSSWLCILLGIFASRFRDIRQLIMSILQILMFITPIFWEPHQLGQGTRAHFLVALNPLYHFVQIVRGPLLNQSPALIDWAITLSIAVIGWIITLRVLGKYRKHIVFWL